MLDEAKGVNIETAGKASSKTCEQHVDDGDA